MKKTALCKKRFCVVLFIVLCLGAMPFLVQAATAPATITTGKTTTLKGYIAGVKIPQKKLKNGDVAYSLSSDKKVPTTMDLKQQKKSDVGLVYLLQNGYPKKSITKNHQYDYYITQAAIWWYLDETTGSKNVTTSFKKNGKDTYHLRKYIQELVKGAKKAKQQGKTNAQLAFQANTSSLSLTSDKKYYESASIKVKGQSIEGLVTVSVSNAPVNTTLVNTQTGENQTTYQVGETFKVRVPVQEVKKLSNQISLSASALGIVDTVYAYQADDTRYQAIIPATLYEEEKTMTAKTSVSLTTSKLTVINIAKETKKALAGANLVLKDAQGKEITSWISTTNAHTIQNLKNGTYTLVETTAPSGYQKDKEVTSFEISSKNLEVTLYISNTKIEKTAVIQSINQDTKKALAGAKLQITNTNGEVITTFVTTEKEYTVENLQDGTYIVQEIASPSGYQATEQYRFTISDQHPKATVTVKHTKVSQVEKSVQIMNLDEKTQAAIAGTHLQVKDEQNQVVADFVTTTENQVVKNLKNGTYTVLEIAAADGYTKTEKQYTFTISEQHPTASVTIKNTKAEIIEDVPNTASSSSVLLKILGFGLILGALTFVRLQGMKEDE